MRYLLLLHLAVVFSAIPAVAQLYDGPASGSIGGGVVVSTDDFPLAPIGPDPEHRVVPHMIVPDNPTPAGLPASQWPETYNAFEYDPTETVTPPPVELGSFQGIPDENTNIPPDPHAAVGPNHVMACVNSRFRISDKQGSTLKTIQASTWYQSVLGGAGPFDPQIMYDHFHGRWIMLWDHLNTGSGVAYWLISVSDDDDPLGTWYNWALPAHLNGSTPSGNWGDYPGIGYDDEALYITSREFSFPGFYQYQKLRIVGTNQLYQNDAGPVTWTDLWDIRDLSNINHDGLRPSVVFTQPAEYYLISPTTFSGTNNYFVLYRLTNPLTSPVMTAVHVPVASWTPAPNASQLGGGMSIEGGGSRVRHAAVYRDSSIWAAHSVANGVNSSIRYIRISTVSNTAIEDARLGATGFWHFYPSLMADRDGNVAITFSRSGTTEYIGAGMMWRLATDPVGLQPAMLFKEGETNYVEDFGSGRNRWGDYMGIALDPSETNNFWMFTEYAASPANTWGTWWYHTRLVPYPAQYVQTIPGTYTFPNLEVGTTPDTLNVSVFNIGGADLTISDLSASHPAYALVDLPSLPVVVGTFDSIAFKVVFNPLEHGDAVDSVVVTSDDPLNPTKAIQLTGRGIVIGAALAGTMYAASGPVNGQLYTVDIATGTSTALGPLGINELHGLAIRPSNHEIFGVNTGVTSTTLYRVASAYGDVHPAATIAVANLRAIAFSAGDTLYGGTTAGMLYRIDPATGATTLVGQATGVAYSGLSFSPTSGRLWGSVRGVIGRDRIYTVNTANADTTLIGRTGDNADTPYLAFGPLGELYGLKGQSAQINTLISIDTVTAVGTLISSTGISGLTAIAMRTDSIVTTVRPDQAEETPLRFGLDQNYPNPFNPATEISYQLAAVSNVSLRVYDVLGREIAVLAEGRKPAGRYVAHWNARNASSGVYYYVLRADGAVMTRKMILIK
jgi:hypothetical protein